ncbi:hypothetical protein Tco_0736153 [Tanacetum coccineum]
MYVIEQPLPVAPAADSQAQVFCGICEKITSANWEDDGESCLLIEYEKGLPTRMKTPKVMMSKGGKNQECNEKCLKLMQVRWGHIFGKGIVLLSCWLLRKEASWLCSSSRDLEKQGKKQGALYLYVGNGVRAQVEAIGSYDLVLPNGLVICLDNCHYAPSNLEVWGCEAFVKRDTPDKLQQRSVKGIFIGYPKEIMGYYFYIPPKNKIVIARFERTHRAPDRLCLNVEAGEHSLGDLNEPTRYKAAMLDFESNKWIDAMNAKIQPMMDNMVWVLVDLPLGCKTVGSK